MGSKDEEIIALLTTRPEDQKTKERILKLIETLSKIKGMTSDTIIAILLKILK